MKKHQSSQSEQQQQSQQQKQKVQFTLYALLELQKSSSVTSQDIKKQYRKLVLKYHPDKNKEDPLARQKFQKLKEAYDILVDPQKRKIYDQTGQIDNMDQAAFKSAYEYFRAMYKPVTQEDILSFEKRYKGSAQQEEDLIQFYNRKGGNMVQLLENIPLSQQKDLQRFIKFYESKFEEGSLKKTKKFTQTKNKIRPLPNQQQEWQEAQQEKKKDLDKLVLAIRSNHQNKAKNFLANLQAKYGGKDQEEEQIAINAKRNRKRTAETSKPNKKRKTTK